MRPLFLDETNALRTFFQLVAHGGTVLLVLLGVAIALLGRKAFSRSTSTRGAGFTIVLLVIGGIAFLAIGVVVVYSYAIGSSQ